MSATAYTIHLTSNNDLSLTISIFFDLNQAQIMAKVMWRALLIQIAHYDNQKNESEPWKRPKTAIFTIFWSKRPLPFLFPHLFIVYVPRVNFNNIFSDALAISIPTNHNNTFSDCSDNLRTQLTWIRIVPVSCQMSTFYQIV